MVSDACVIVAADSIPTEIIFSMSGLLAESALLHWIRVKFCAIARP